MDGTEEIDDLDEALLVISLKNDEINNLKSSLRAAEKKHNLKLTDLQFRIDQEKGRCAEVERKLAKAEEGAGRARLQLEEQLRKAQEERQRQADSINQIQNEARKKERELKAALFESQLHLDREREASGRLASELEVLQGHFDPKKILPALQKKSLEEIPSYMELLRRGAQRAEEARQLGLQMERLRSETYQGMEESFKKLSSYEAVMESLKLKNKELEESIQEKEEELELHSQQIDQKSQLLEEVKGQASEEVAQLSDQLHSLTAYFHHAPEPDSPHPAHHHDLLRAIEELQAAVEEGEGQLSAMQSQYEERLLQLREENEALRQDLLAIHATALAQKEDFEAAIAAERREVAEKEDLIVLLSNSIKEQEEFFEGKQAEFDSHIADLTELLRKKKRSEEEARENEGLYKMQVESLSDELVLLRRHLYTHEPSHSDRNQTYQEQEEPAEDSHRLLRRARSGLESLKSFGERRNLMADIQDNEGEERTSRVDFGSYEQEPNWSELYYSLLKKHNDFARKVQERLQAMAMASRRAAGSK